MGKRVSHKNRVYLDVVTGNVGKPTSHVSFQWSYSPRRGVIIYSDILHCYKSPERFIHIPQFDTTGDFPHMKGQLSSNGEGFYVPSFDDVEARCKGYKQIFIRLNSEHKNCRVLNILNS